MSEAPAPSAGPPGPPAAPTAAEGQPGEVLQITPEDQLAGKAGAQITVLHPLATGSLKDDPSRAALRVSLLWADMLDTPPLTWWQLLFFWQKNKSALPMHSSVKILPEFLVPMPPNQPAKELERCGKALHQWTVMSLLREGLRENKVIVVDSLTEYAMQKQAHILPAKHSEHPCLQGTKATLSEVWDGRIKQLTPFLVDLALVSMMAQLSPQHRVQYIMPDVRVYLDSLHASYMGRARLAARLDRPLQKKVKKQLDRAAGKK